VGEGCVGGLVGGGVVGAGAFVGEGGEVPGLQSAYVEVPEHT